MSAEPGLTLNGYQLKSALEFLAPDGTREQLESDVGIFYGKGHSGEGYYAALADCPEEGSILPCLSG